ncbi:MAG: hypothetical protein KDB53_21835, partial [Planctomycetes bacterium]|nr:hypothetical protein [Planctomycetota bacterium]
RAASVDPELRPEDPGALAQQIEDWIRAQGAGHGRWGRTAGWVFGALILASVLWLILRRLA